MLTHDNWDAELSEVDRIITLNQGENYVSWLPLAHVFGQLVDNHLWCRSAIHMHVVDNALHVVDYAKRCSHTYSSACQGSTRKYTPASIPNLVPGAENPQRPTTDWRLIEG